MTTVFREIMAERKALIRREKRMEKRGASPKSRQMSIVGSDSKIIPRFYNTAGYASLQDSPKASGSLDLGVLAERQQKNIRKEAELKVLEEERRKLYEESIRDKLKEASKNSDLNKKEWVKKIEEKNKKREVTMERLKELERIHRNKIKAERDKQLQDSKYRTEKFAEIEKEKRKAAIEKEEQYRKKMDEICLFHESLKSMEEERMKELMEKIDNKGRESTKNYEKQVKEKAFRMREINERISRKIEDTQYKRKEDEESKVQILKAREAELNKRLQQRVKEMTSEWKEFKEKGEKLFQYSQQKRKEELMQQKMRQKDIARQLRESDKGVTQNLQKKQKQLEIKIEKNKMKKQDMEENKKRQDRIHANKVQQLIDKYRRTDEWLKSKREMEERAAQQRKDLQFQAKIERERMLKTIHVYSTKPIAKQEQKKILNEFGIDASKVPTKKKKKKKAEEDEQMMMQV
eukprot:TRINITY_DN15370_c0_g1_i1.p1 TRINITY_DN15370_c0_g1~~TRINITY_DN15370_c0_g1_i1.p1  ORF type:complete len:530 (+),score=113.36 TRINITY_DN15370_c0_g1_i1:205-1590(+)